MYMYIYVHIEDINIERYNVKTFWPFTHAGLHYAFGEKRGECVL